MKRHHKILDCTLRDGGYLNKWKWDEDLVRHYLEVVTPHVGIVELGYIRPDVNVDFRWMVPNASPGCYTCAMIDLKEYIVNGSLGVSKLCRTLCGVTPDNFLDYIRIAYTVETVDDMLETTKIIKGFGFSVIASLMRMSTLGPGDIASVRRKTISASISALHSPNILYFADSYGAKPSFCRVLDIDDGFAGHKIGLHLHANSSHKALHEAMLGTNLGMYVDTTLGGIGRGAGNIDLVDMIHYLEGDNLNYDTLIDFQGLADEMKKATGYRSDSYTKLIYMVAADLNLHPSIPIGLIEKNVDIRNAVEMMRGY